MKTIIGWRESISLPDLGVDHIKVKVDTGARTSALHVSNVEYFVKSRKQYVRFHIHPEQKKFHPMITTESELVEMREVRSSNGKVSLRPVIETAMILGGSVRLIELTLVNRDMMGFRMLLGREALRREFIVDPGKSFLVSQR